MFHPINEGELSKELGLTCEERMLKREEGYVAALGDGIVSRPAFGLLFDVDEAQGCKRNLKSLNW